MTPLPSAVKVSVVLEKFYQNTSAVAPTRRTALATCAQNTAEPRLDGGVTVRSSRAIELERKQRDAESPVRSRGEWIDQSKVLEKERKLVEWKLGV